MYRGVWPCSDVYIPAHPRGLPGESGQSWTLGGEVVVHSHRDAGDIVRVERWVGCWAVGLD